MHPETIEYASDLNTTKYNYINALPLLSVEVEFSALITALI